MSQWVLKVLAGEHEPVYTIRPIGTHQMHHHAAADHHSPFVAAVVGAAPGVLALL